MYKTESFKPDTFKPARFESDGKITLSGKEIPYHTICEDNIIYGPDGNPVASIFTYAYFRSDVEDTSNRPVVFAYNGGPGSSCMYVHAGFLGTRRMQYDEVDRESAFGPYKVIDNPDCLIDIADIVLIDPVGTGYGVLIDESKKKDFFGIEQDAEALLTVLEAWVRRYNRGLSPKYLCGESYGCTRSAVAAGIAATMGRERGYGIAFDGIVFIGNTVTVGKYFGEGLPVETSVLGFPTYAGVNWYHNHPTNQSVEDFVKDLELYTCIDTTQENFNKLLLEKDESLVYACLSLRPKSMEELLKKTGFAMPQMADILQRLIQKDFITESFKNYYIRKI